MANWSCHTHTHALTHIDTQPNTAVSKAPTHQHKYKPFVS